MRLLFYIEDMLVQRDKLKAKMEELERSVPPRMGSGTTIQPLPTASARPDARGTAEYDLYGMFFKDIQINFGESLSNPWIQDIVYRDPVHIGAAC
jgi:hypothetical protein